MATTVNPLVCVCVSLMILATLTRLELIHTKNRVVRLWQKMGQIGPKMDKLI